MKLLRVIPIEDKVYRMVYLEDYKMLATIYYTRFIKFYSIPSGKLERMIDLGIEKWSNLLLMKDKNFLGVVSPSGDMIKILRLHGK